MWRWAGKQLMGSAAKCELRAMVNGVDLTLTSTGMCTHTHTWKHMNAQLTNTHRMRIGKNKGRLGMKEKENKGRRGGQSWEATTHPEDTLRYHMATGVLPGSLEPSLLFLRP